MREFRYLIGFSLGSILAIVWVNQIKAADKPADPLWQKAVAVAQSNENWVAGLTVMTVAVGHKGKTEGTYESWSRSSPGNEGRINRETVKAIEDGKDVTEREKKKEAKARQAEKNKTETKQSGASPPGNPFDPEIQDRVFITPLAPENARNIEGKPCAGYSFVVRNTNGPTARGTAWLAKETGTPVEIENMTIDPLPEKSLKAMAITTRYQITTNGAWRVAETVTKSKVRVLLITIDLVTTNTYSEYWKNLSHEFTPARKSQ
ncbi:MAG TPA: hypothetical protein VHH73_01405 [Verrucomicrobiae bacterium]|nr:hypothetical protein [Verrucomicrobiae bacterium]